MSIAPAASTATETWQRLEPPVLPDIPAMTSKAERRYYYWLTRERFSGEGAVVEIGCWLGGGTVYLAAGLRDRGSTAKVTCVDRFEWAGEIYERAFPANLARGDDFEPLFRANTTFVAEHIDVIRADLKDLSWTGSSIELLLVDAPKETELLINFLKGFGPHLIVGKSVIVFQDYLHGPAYALPAILSELDEFRLVDVVLPGTTVTFELTRPLDLREERLARCRFARWGAAETTDRWAKVMGCLPEAARERLALSLPMLLHDQGHVDAAIAETRRIAGQRWVQHCLATWSENFLAIAYRPLFEAAGWNVKPTTAHMHFWESTNQLRLGDRDAAKRSLEEALRLEPNYAPARNRLELMEREDTQAERVRARAAAKFTAISEKFAGRYATIADGALAPAAKANPMREKRAVVAKPNPPPMRRAIRALKRLVRAVMGHRRN